MEYQKLKVKFSWSSACQWFLWMLFYLTYVLNLLDLQIHILIK